MNPRAEPRDARARRPAQVLGWSLASLLVLAGCERAKTTLDREVDRLCAIDGGVRVFTTVTLPRENFGPDGQVFPQYRHLTFDRGALGEHFTAIFRTDTLVTGNPGLARYSTRVVHRATGEVLGELVIYRRAGGDFTGPWEPSVHSCPAGPRFDLERHIFKPAEAA